MSSSGQENVYVWECFEWKWFDGEEYDFEPCKYLCGKCRDFLCSTDIPSSAFLASKKDLEPYKKSAEYGDAIKLIVEAYDNIREATRNVEKLSDKATRRYRHKTLADRSGLLASILLGLNMIVATQHVHGVEQQARELTRKWRDTMRERSDEANEAVRDNNRIARYDEPFKDNQAENEEWVGFWPLGAGGFGSTLLYTLQDEHGRICNRVVVKDCDYDSKKKRSYWDELKWFWKKNQKGKKVPVEVQAMADLRGKVRI